MAEFNIWSFWAKRYEGLWVQKYSLGPTRREIIDKVKAEVKKRNLTVINVLDMGCGTGQLLRDIQREFSKCEVKLTGVDMSKGMIEEAGKKSSGIEYVNSSVDTFQTEEKYDFITCSHSFPYYPNKEAAIEKFSLWLKDGGCLFLAQASSNSFYDSIAMFFVKFTTSKAKYLNINTLNTMALKYFANVGTSIIKEKWYMPTICLMTCSKRGEKL